jgi:very-short-patch-repair endonuclease
MIALCATDPTSLGWGPVSGLEDPRWIVINATLLHLAHQQFGVISRSQLIERLGFTSSSLYRARRAGLLVDVTHRVVRVASSPETFEMRCAAAQLTTDEVGFLSSWTSARLRGLRRMPENRVHFTVPPGVRLTTPRWMDVHRSEWFDADRDSERSSSGLIVATPLRMLFGLAADFNQFRFERAAEDAWHLGLITPDAAAQYLEAHRCRGKDGVSTMERWLDRTSGRRRPAQSELERDLLQAIERTGLPSPVRQHPLVLPDGALIHVDIAWPEIRFGVEPGASWWHGGDHGQRRDQSRDRVCGEVGWHVIRFDESMRADPDAAAAQIARIHAQRTELIPKLEQSSR